MELTLIFINNYTFKKILECARLGSVAKAVFINESRVRKLRNLNIEKLID